MTAESLIAALLSLATWITPMQAKIHVEAALIAEEESGIEAETLLAMAYLESRYVPNVVSHVKCRPVCATSKDGSEICSRACTRSRFRIKSASNLPKRYSAFCGPLQLKATSWQDCLALASNIKDAYSRSADHLRGWLTHAPRKYPIDSDKRLFYGLIGYGGGFKALEEGRLKHYPRKILKLRNKIKRLANNHEQRRVHPRSIQRLGLQRISPDGGQNSSSDPSITAYHN